MDAHFFPQFYKGSGSYGFEKMSAAPLLAKGCAKRTSRTGDSREGNTTTTEYPLTWSRRTATASVFSVAPASWGQPALLKRTSSAAQRASCREKALLIAQATRQAKMIEYENPFAYQLHLRTRGASSGPRRRRATRFSMSTDAKKNGMHR